jgi:transposase-like protein
LIRNLARRLEHDAPGVSASILEGLDEILTVTRLRLPKELRRALACTNIVENVMSTVRRVCRNVKRWRSASMALRAAMQEAGAYRTFRPIGISSRLQSSQIGVSLHPD